MKWHKWCKVVSKWGRFETTFKREVTSHRKRKLKQDFFFSLMESVTTKLFFEFLSLHHKEVIRCVLNYILRECLEYVKITHYAMCEYLGRYTGVRVPSGDNAALPQSCQQVVREALGWESLDMQTERKHCFKKVGRNLKFKVGTAGLTKALLCSHAAFHKVQSTSMFLIFLGNPRRPG